ncbi:hypothetical protein [Borrelia duttonii]|uniref:hypothetical protein n=1 Tax=Borrelia duttonii TaxID=40834 RepID=UPI00056F3890|nr:hypothetical protein [Borrelia duttonii]
MLDRKKKLVMICCNSEIEGKISMCTWRIGMLFRFFTKVRQLFQDILISMFNSFGMLLRMQGMVSLLMVTMLMM